MMRINYNIVSILPNPDSSDKGPDQRTPRGAPSPAPSAPPCRLLDGEDSNDLASLQQGRSGAPSTSLASRSARDPLEPLRCWAQNADHVGNALGPLRSALQAESRATDDGCTNIDPCRERNPCNAGVSGSTPRPSRSRRSSSRIPDRQEGCEPVQLVRHGL